MVSDITGVKRESALRSAASDRIMVRNIQVEGLEKFYKVCNFTVAELNKLLSRCSAAVVFGSLVCTTRVSR
jgi:hypothetical protein